MSKIETWAFIDYENIHTLENIDLSQYQQLVVFIGSSQDHLRFGSNKPNLPITMTLIRMKAISTNNLDFHLSYYMGKFGAELDKNVEFHVLSNDKGFDPLIAHIKLSGRLCKRVPVVIIGSESMNEALQSQRSIDYKKVLLRLESTAVDKRPKTEDSLKNFIKTHLALPAGDISIQRYFNSLISTGVVSKDGVKLAYKR